MDHSKICLCIIVKNEEHFILAALESVEKYIDYWIILDSQSTDETEQIVRHWAGDTGIPGKFLQYEEPYRGDHKRNRALQLCREHAEFTCDYILVMDADNVLELTGDDPFYELDQDAYLITIAMGDIRYPILAMYRIDIEWKVVGIIHDYRCRADDEPFTQALLPGVMLHEPLKSEGPRMKTKHHFLGDALIIERELHEHAGTMPQLLMHRYVFYLAQSYKDAGYYERAIECYIARIKFGGWYEEVWYSCYQVARILQWQEKPSTEVARYYANCIEINPARKEAVYALMLIYTHWGLRNLAILIGQYSSKVKCIDTLFIEPDIYENKFPQLMATLLKPV